MIGRDQPLDRRYLHNRRRVDEATALRRIRATTADLDLWRRDPAFRAAESAAKAAPRKGGAQMISLDDVLAKADPQAAAEMVRDAIARSGIRTDRLGRWINRGE